MTPTLDAWVLAAIAQTTRPLSGRQLARQVEHGSLGGVQKALARLVEQGIVLADAHPSATFFTLNRNHLGATPVIQLAALANALVQRLTCLIQSWQVQPQHAYLFGSAARQDGDTSSDIDVLVVHRQQWQEPASAWAQQVDDLATKIERWTGNDAGIVDLSAADVDRMKANKEAILDSWQRDAILLAGQELAGLQVRSR